MPRAAPYEPLRSEEERAAKEAEEMAEVEKAGYPKGARAADPPSRAALAEGVIQRTMSARRTGGTEHRQRFLSVHCYL